MTEQKEIADPVCALLEADSLRALEEMITEEIYLTGLSLLGPVQVYIMPPYGTPKFVATLVERRAPKPCRVAAFGSEALRDVVEWVEDMDRDDYTLVGPIAVAAGADGSIEYVGTVWQIQLTKE